MKKSIIILGLFLLGIPCLAEDFEIKAPTVDVTLKSSDSEAKIIGYSVNTIINGSETNFSMQKMDVPFILRLKAGALRIFSNYSTQQQITGKKSEVE